jgi:hypothetical protein
VWEHQFDYNDDELRRLARTPHEQIDFSDLWFYYHDLAYVELQRDLFNYLFPACLMHWHHSLMENKSCSHGDSEFHYGIHRGKVLEKMVTPKQRDVFYEFFRDSFLERLDRERGFISAGWKTPAHGWIHRFNSVGLIMPRIDLLWNPWWEVDTPGRAVAALEYCSGLMYFEGDNPLFEAWTRGHGDGGPDLWANDSQIYETGWMVENIEFLTTTLNVDYVNGRVAKAAARLKDEPEWENAQRLVDDLPEAQELLALRVTELPQLLSKPPSGVGWSI